MDCNPVINLKKFEQFGKDGYQMKPISDKLQKLFCEKRKIISWLGK